MSTYKWDEALSEAMRALHSLAGTHLALWMENGVIEFAVGDSKFAATVNAADPVFIWQRLDEHDLLPHNLGDAYDALLDEGIRSDIAINRQHYSLEG